MLTTAIAADLIGEGIFNETCSGGPCSFGRCPRRAQAGTGANHQMTTATNLPWTSETSSELYARVVTLLRDYPGSSLGEVQEILGFIKQGPMFERALLTANDEIRPQLERFRTDHAKALALQPRDYVFIVLVMAMLVFATYYFWDIAAGG